MATYRYYRTERAVILAFAAIAISLSSMIACGGSAALREPVVSTALLLALLAAVLAYPFLLACLLPTRLDMSLPLLGVVTVGATWLSFTWLGLNGLVVGLLVSIATMFLCRRWFADAGLEAPKAMPQPRDRARR